MNIHRLRLVFFIFLILLTTLLSCQLERKSLFTKRLDEREGSQMQGEERITRDLSGFQWRMKRMRPGQGVKEGFPELPPGDIETHNWNYAEVPGDVYTDLWKAGIIEDPYYGRNSAKAKWVMFYEWWYSLQFTVLEEMQGVIRLVFEGVDYSCEVWLNGTYLGSHEGMFSPFSFEVTDVVKSGKGWREGINLLMIKLNPPPQVYNKVAGRKIPWYGDYWRDLVPFGIWRPVKLVVTGPVRIDNIYAKSELKDDGSADLSVEVELENYSKRRKEITVNAKIQGRNFQGKTYTTSMKREIGPGLHKVRANLSIKDPKLWWPWDLGEQNLYQAQITVEEDGMVHDSTETTFGIREVKMEWNPGFTEEEVSYPRTVKINGKYHYLRSACWGGPPDIFFGRTSKKEYQELIRLAKEANINNLRIFGWHPPEIPEFYKLCNEAGITVWQDIIPLGMGNLPKDKEFLEATLKEAIAVVKKQRNHPCLILLEGGEEVFLRADDPQFTKDFLAAIGDTIKQYISLPYVPSSPMTYPPAIKVGFKPKEAVHAHREFYNAGRQVMEEYYPTLDYPIVPELAITSVPCISSLKKFIPPDELWPPGPSWGYHWADLDRLCIINFEVFGDQSTSSLEEFVSATQDAQGTIFQFAIEHFRRRKPRTSGISICHFITYWPDMKWGIVDNYQEPKNSYEFVKRAYQPLLVSLQYPKRRWLKEEVFKANIWVVNDYFKSYQNCKVKMQIIDSKGKLLKQESFDIESISPNSSKQYVEVNWNISNIVQDNFKVELSLIDSKDQDLSANHYTFLIGDQEKAKQKLRQLGEEVSERNSKFTYPNYYRFYPEIIREGDKNWQTGEIIPRARGF